MRNLCKATCDPRFDTYFYIGGSTGDFISQAEVPIYEDLQEFTSLKRFMEDALDDYNSTPGVISMDLVLFRDAIEHGKVGHSLICYIMPPISQNSS